jgi:hypothetical protein
VWISSIVVPLNDDALDFAKDGVFCRGSSSFSAPYDAKIVKLWVGLKSVFLFCKIFLNVIYERLHILWGSICRYRIRVLKLNSLYHCIVTVTLN